MGALTGIPENDTMRRVIPIIEIMDTGALTGDTGALTGAPTGDTDARTGGDTRPPSAQSS